MDISPIYCALIIEWEKVKTYPDDCCAGCEGIITVVLSLLETARVVRFLEGFGSK